LSSRFSCLAVVVLAVGTLAGCTDDYALLDALPGTWEQTTDGSLIEFTRSPTPLSYEGDEYHGHAVTSGGGLVDLVRDLRDDCVGAGELGFLWAVVDRSKYGNMRFALDPDFSSAASSDACQTGGRFSFEYPILASEARSFTIGTPELEVLGVEADEIETFRAVSLDILDRPAVRDGSPPRPDGGAAGGDSFGGGGIADGDRVAFYNGGASQVVARALQPVRAEVGSSLTLTSGSTFATIAAGTPRAVWTVERIAPVGDLSNYAYLVNEAIADSHALETQNGSARSSVQPRGTDSVFSGQAIRFEDVGTCGELGFALCPTPSSAVVRIYSLFVEDPGSGMTRGSQALSLDVAEVRTETRSDDAFQLWIVQEL